MAVIFYAVCGEGMGHATRSEVVINHLLSKKHKIVIFSYQRAFEYLNKTFSDNKNVLDIIKIHGVNFIYEDNEFKFAKTVWREYSQKLSKMIFKNFRSFVDNILEHSPSISISDGEPSITLFSKLLKIQTMCVDNVNVVAKCDVECKLSNKIQAIIVEKNLEADFNFISTVFKVPIKDKYKGNTVLMGPIIRKEILNAKTTNKNHILVYQTSTSNDLMFDILKESKEKFIIYGFNIEKKDKNLTFKKSSKKGFAKDLASSKGVITNGGYSLISEAIILEKPIYSIPVKNQVEQEINGYYIEKLGYGIQSKEINLTDLGRFINNLKKFKDNISNFSFKVNDFRLLDQKIEYYSNKYSLPKRTKLIARIKTEHEILITKLKIQDKKKRKKIVKDIKDKAKKIIGRN